MSRGVSVQEGGLSVRPISITAAADATGVGPEQF